MICSSAPTQTLALWLQTDVSLSSRTHNKTSDRMWFTVNNKKTSLSFFPWSVHGKSVQSEFSLLQQVKQLSLCQRHKNGLHEMHLLSTFFAWVGIWLVQVHTHPPWNSVNWAWILSTLLTTLTVFFIHLFTLHLQKEFTQCWWRCSTLD